MILPDANLLIYAYDYSSPLHIVARSWLEEQFAGAQPVCLTWTTINAFLRISTTDFAHRKASRAEALEVVTSWLSLETIRVVSPGPRHWPILESLIVSGNSFGRHITDAHLAALAIEHDATFCTHDRDFQRFPGLKLQFPLS